LGLRSDGSESSSCRANWAASELIDFSNYSSCYIVHAVHALCCMLIDVLAFLFGALLLLEDHINLILVWDHILVRPPFLTRHIIGWIFFLFQWTCFTCYSRKPYQCSTNWAQTS